MPDASLGQTLSLPLPKTSAQDPSLSLLSAVRTLPRRSRCCSWPPEPASPWSLRHPDTHHVTHPTAISCCFRPCTTVQNHTGLLFLPDQPPSLPLYAVLDTALDVTFHRAPGRQARWLDDHAFSSSNRTDATLQKSSLTRSDTPPPPPVANAEH
jgi:hypothetical protein